MFACRYVSATPDVDRVHCPFRAASRAAWPSCRSDASRQLGLGLLGLDVDMKGDMMTEIPVNDCVG
jgi:hypothetical protein